MAVKIRLARRGRKKLAIYDVVVSDARAPRDGKYIERIGRYNPNTNPATVDIDEQKAFEWVMNGAQPTETVRAMLRYRGILLRKHLQVGVNKGAITQEEADKRLEDWMSQKEVKIQSKRDRLASEAEQKASARKDAESKVKEARAEELRKRAEASAQKEEATAEEEAPEQPEATADDQEEKTES
jgi:small subunit ribosomal protein S16